MNHLWSFPDSRRLASQYGFAVEVVLDFFAGDLGLDLTELRGPVLVRHLRQQPGVREDFINVILALVFLSLFQLFRCKIKQPAIS